MRTSVGWLSGSTTVRSFSEGMTTSVPQVSSVVR